MLLAADIGNTNAVFGLFREGALLLAFRFPTWPEATSDLLFSHLHTTLEIRGLSLRQIRLLATVSVVPAWERILLEAARAQGWKVHLLKSSLYPHPVRYHPPEAVGADRLANALAAKHLYGVPALVVDFGTATTFDAVGREGEYLGGAIAPGLLTAAEALFSRAALLPRVRLSPPRRALGQKTEESLSSGIILGKAAQVAGMVERLKKEMGGEVRVIATGGLAGEVAPFCPALEIIDEHLTLKGAALWARLLEEGGAKGCSGG
jgi:type III pantothenate kinase